MSKMFCHGARQLQPELKRWRWVGNLNLKCSALPLGSNGIDFSVCKMLATCQLGSVSNIGKHIEPSS